MCSETPLNIFTLPLFPLHTVLFPHAPLQLHIFEERYRVMIHRCLERQESFGVLLIREGAEVGKPAVPFETGCMAAIRAIKRMEDGRMHLLAEGTERFRLLDYSEAELPYLVGKVEPLADKTADAQGLLLATDRLTDTFMDYLRLITGQKELTADEVLGAADCVSLPEDPTSLAYYVASVCPFSSLFRQELLEMTDPLLRLETVADMVRAEIHDH